MCRVPRHVMIEDDLLVTKLAYSTYVARIKVSHMLAYL